MRYDTAPQHATWHAHIEHVAHRARGTSSTGCLCILLVSVAQLALSVILPPFIRRYFPSVYTRLACCHTHTHDTRARTSMSHGAMHRAKHKDPSVDVMSKQQIHVQFDPMSTSVAPVHVHVTHARATSVSVAATKTTRDPGAAIPAIHISSISLLVGLQGQWRDTHTHTHMYTAYIHTLSCTYLRVHVHVYHMYTLLLLFSLHRSGE